MKSAVRKIDRALKSLNQLETPQSAENYLLKQMPGNSSSESSQDFHGALLVRSAGKMSVSLGIYFTPKVSETLTQLESWNPNAWSHDEVKAVTVATEEISHFHYLLANASIGRPISQLELELQGEIDKFMLLFFTLASTEENIDSHFVALFEMLFQHFHLRETLSADEKERYQAANNIAKSFVIKCRKYLEDKDYDSALKILRQFYRMNTSEKLSLTLRK